MFNSFKQNRVRRLNVYSTASSRIEVGGQTGVQLLQAESRWKAKRLISCFKQNRGRRLNDCSAASSRIELEGQTVVQLFQAELSFQLQSGAHRRMWATFTIVYTLRYQVQNVSPLVKNTWNVD